MTDVQKQTFQHIFEKIVASNNKFPPKEIENFRSLLENVRDRDQKNFNMIMEKLKSWDHMESDMFREGIVFLLVSTPVEITCLPCHPTVNGNRATKYLNTLIENDSENIIMKHISSRPLRVF